MARFKEKVKSFEFKPFSTKQKQMLHFWREGSPHKDADMIIADGSIRSGKTIAMICSFLMWSQSNFKGKDFIIAGKSVGALKRNVIKPMKQILSAWNWNYEHNRSENYLQIGSNTYYLFGANNESSQDVIQGLTAAGGYGDEVALFPKSFVEQMIGRCSLDGSKLFFNCNPKGPYHYIKEEMIDMAEERKIYCMKFLMTDNLTMSKAKRDFYDRSFTGVFYQRNILGLWVMAEGIIYDMFDDDIHIVPTVDRNYSKYYVSMDYGTQNPMAMGLWGKLGNKWYMIKEYHYSGRDKGIQRTDKQYANDYEAFVGNLKIEKIIVDPSASSFIAELEQRGFYVQKARNDVGNGIRKVSTALTDEKILFNDCCKETFREFKSYVWNEKSSQRGIDEPIKENDHHMDLIRYFVNTVLVDHNRFTFG